MALQATAQTSGHAGLASPPKATQKTLVGDLPIRKHLSSEERGNVHELLEVNHLTSEL